VIVEKFERLPRVLWRHRVDAAVGVIFVVPGIFLAYVILSGLEDSSPARFQGRGLPLEATDSPSVTEVPSPGTTSVQRVRVPGPDRTVLSYQTSVAPGRTSLVRQTISEVLPGVTSRSTETVAGQIVTSTVTADGSTVVVPGPTTTVTVTETVPAETITMQVPEATITLTEPPPSD
jgi:hypothetical protein